MRSDHPRQLLELARSFIDGKPNRARLHRAVSSAYYAIFHLLVSDGVRLLAVKEPLRRQAGRAFDHGTMRDVCEAIKAGRLPKGLQGIVPLP